MREGEDQTPMKNLYQKFLSTVRGTSICLAFFSYGLLGVLPGSSQVQLKVSVPEAQSVGSKTPEKTDTSTDERCRLQADVALFLTLQQNSALQTNVPCQEGSQVVFKALGKAHARTDEALRDTVLEMTGGYPIEVMAPAIAKYDREVAALIVGIAKKESDWGKHVPLDSAGADCFNYWGYKGAGTRGVAMGHGCFGSPEEAVTAVGDRLTELVAIRQTSEPANMIIWKCGSSCKGHSDVSVKKWISDVSFYYHQIVSRPLTYVNGSR